MVNSVIFDARTQKEVDSYKKGILDPTKVTRSALQNAASIAGLMITTEAMVGEVKKEKSDAHGGMGGGMGGMAAQGGAECASWLPPPSSQLSAVRMIIGA